MVLSGDVVALLPDADVTVDVDQFDAPPRPTRRRWTPPRRRGDPALPGRPAAGGPVRRSGPSTSATRRRLRYLELLKDAGRWDEVLAADPLDEGAHLRLVEGHVAAGDRDAALRQLDFMEQVWRRELDDEPGRGRSSAARRGARAWRRTTPTTGRAVRARRRRCRGRPPTRSGGEQDIAQVLEALELSQVVTLVGPGGVGKTRLAQEVAHRYADATSGQVCFVDLTKAREPGLVAEVVARGLGVQVTAGQRRRAGPRGGVAATGRC